MSKRQTTNDRATIVNTLTKFRPGTMVDIQLSAGDSQRIKAKLVGYQEGGYFAFSIPQQVYAENMQRVFEGKSCVVRMMAEGDVGVCVAFKTQVMTLNKKPQILLFVQYPQQIEFFSLRSNSRISTHLPVLVSEQQDTNTLPENITQRLEGVVLDLSEGGCRIEVAAPANQHRLSMVFVQLILRFPLTPEKPIVLNGQIKSQQHSASNTLRVGIQFETNKHLTAMFNKLNLFTHPGFAA
ncbi:flagellar brake domain-containing protein [Agarivorans sp. DSG3-1]|uniref:flagellar brake domain-containing protein n=1 Tax=Agarivorans sp. DSG3-1 TaxID=3342249 RepID=UPI00398E5B06